MKASELRIGNIINVLGKDREVLGLSRWNGSAYTSRTYVEFEGLVPIKTIHLKPILLTEEWLLKFGFEWYHPLEHYRLVINDVWFSIQYDHELPFFQFVNLGYDESMISCPVLIEYVHQLQNLYHALTGHELKTKQDDK